MDLWELNLSANNINDDSLNSMIFIDKAMNKEMSYELSDKTMQLVQ